MKHKKVLSILLSICMVLSVAPMGALSALAYGANSIHIFDTRGGTITTDRSSAESGETVTITVSVDEGYRMNELSARTLSDALPLTQISDNQYTFIMPDEYTSVIADFTSHNIIVGREQGLLHGRVEIRNETRLGGEWEFDHLGFLNEGSAYAMEGDTLVVTVYSDAGYTVSYPNIYYINPEESGYGQIDKKVTGGTSKTIYEFVTPTNIPYDLFVDPSFKKVDYNVNIDSEITNGSVSSDVNTAQMGDTVNLTVTPDSGYILDTLSVTDSSSHAVEVTSNSFEMPASNVTVSATFKSELEQVTYYDENGDEDSVAAKYISDTDTELTEGWYAVSGDTTIDGWLEYSGDVKIILTDSSKLTVNGINTQDAASDNLTIYGQSGGTGQLKTNGTIYADVFTMNGGVVEADSVLATDDMVINGGSISGKSLSSWHDITVNGGNIDMLSTSGINYALLAEDDVTINGGTLSLVSTGTFNMPSYGTQYSHGILGDNVTINGGTVYAEGSEGGGYGIKLDTYAPEIGKITLGCSSYSDSITISNFSHEVNIAENQTLTDGTDLFSGTITDTSVLNGKALSLYIDPISLIDFNISVDNNVQNGSIQADKSVAKKDEVVSLTATPAEDYELEAWVVTDGDNNPVEVNSDSFVMPASDVTVSAIFRHAQGTVEYIDANGEPQSVTAKFISSTDTELTGGWYAIEENTTISNWLEYSGDVKLILVDSTKLTVNGINTQDAASDNLTIYGQSGGTGQLKTNGTIYADVFTMNGGVVEADSVLATDDMVINGGSISGKSLSSWHDITVNGGNIDMLSTSGINYALLAEDDVTINGGTLSLVSTGTFNMPSYGTQYSHGILGDNVTINGGTVYAEGSEGGGYGIKLDTYAPEIGKITLGCSSYSDSITISNFSHEVNIAENQTLTDGTDLFSGTITDTSVLNGKTLRIAKTEPENYYSLTLDDGIKVNFYIDTPFYEAEGGTIKYSYLTTTEDKSAERTVYEVNVNDLEQQDNGTRKLSLSAAPAQLAEDYIIEVYDAGGTKKATITASIEDYCQAIVASNDSRLIPYKDIAQSLLNYGALADEYFGYAELSKAVTGNDYTVAHSENYKDDVDISDSSHLRTNAHAALTQGSVQISSVSYVALLEPEFRFYLNGITEAQAAKLEVSVDSGLTAQTVKTPSGICVKVTGLKASEFAKSFTLTIGDTVLTYNGYAYLYTALTNESVTDTKLKDLAKGVYRYACAAEAIFA